MSPSDPSADIRLQILHDHYKETFARIRDSEKARDRLFLRVIGVFALLIVQVGYPALVGSALGKVTILGAELDLTHLPLAALLNAAWVLTLALCMRYCQTSVLINRQYPYLHELENAISPAIGGGTLYHREGKFYLDEYPFLLTVAWVAYGFVFPFIVIMAAIALIALEFTKVPYPLYHTLFDAALAVAIIFVFVAYAVQPALARAWRMRSSRRESAPENLT